MRIFGLTFTTFAPLWVSITWASWDLISTNLKAYFSSMSLVGNTSGLNQYSFTLFGSLTIKTRWLCRWHFHFDHNWFQTFSQSVRYFSVIRHFCLGKAHFFELSYVTHLSSSYVPKCTRPREERTANIGKQI